MPRSRPPYPEEFRREAVVLVRSARDRSVPQIAQELGISGQTLRNWIRQAEVDRGARHGLSSDEREELGRLRRENRIHAASRGLYGSPRVCAELCEEGVRVGQKRVWRLMVAAGLEGGPHAPAAGNDGARGGHRPRR